MKKILYIASILLLGAVSCTKELKEVVNPTPDNRDMVAVTMELQVPVSLAASTKANDRADLPHIDDIHVAVFGTSSYPQTYTLADPVDEYATENGTTYHFKVLLPVYEGEAIVHIIANGDKNITFHDQTENSIMSKMVTTDNVGGYWARVVLKEGILPKKDTNGIMQTDQQTGDFIPSDETANAFKGLVLVRNFAEVTLKVPASSGLTNVSWAIVNDPVSGSIAPMIGTEYVDDYKDYVYDDKTGKMVLCDTETDESGKLVPKRDAEGKIVNLKKTYNGYMVSTALNTLPAVESGLNWKSASQPQFVYERVDPNKKDPSYIMMKGTFTDGNVYYYRVDLMDENVGGYFPLYRNYKYQIGISTVGNAGATDYKEAANRNSGGNVSMSAETATLTDVSDGFSRMFVQYVEKTFTAGGPGSFWVYYIPDVTTGVVDNSSIEVSLKNGELGTALANDTFTIEEVAGSSVGLLDVDKVKKVTFTLNGQSASTDLVSEIEVKATNGKTGAQKSTLYRDIKVKVMKVMQMDLGLAPATLSEGTDKETVLHIALADTLQPSMFPLEFYIEDSNRTLNPTGKDGASNSIEVPVKIGESIWDTANKNSYYFIRTVNWSEYEPMLEAWKAAKEAGRSTDGLIDFTTQFKTVKENSATTIYVDNEYFNMDDIVLTCKHFSVSTTMPVVSYHAGTAQVTVSANAGVAWTATVDNGGGLTKATGETTITGEGTESFTINYDANNTAQEKVYTITVTSEGLGSVSTTITQRRAPASPAPFSPSSFTSRTGSSDSEDGYLTVTLNAQNLSNDYITVRRNNTITFTPKNGATITEITITYTNQNRMDTAPSFSPSGTVTPSEASQTWKGTSASAVTYTCGRNSNDPQIKSISVSYN